MYMCMYVLLVLVNAELVFFKMRSSGGSEMLLQWTVPHLWATQIEFGGFKENEVITFDVHGRRHRSRRNLGIRCI